jgi:hypothetical protein
MKKKLSSLLKGCIHMYVSIYRKVDDGYLHTYMVRIRTRYNLNREISIL